jgi:hypothetical protein
MQSTIIARRGVEEDEDNYTKALKLNMHTLCCFPLKLVSSLFELVLFYKQLYELGI